MTNCSTYTGDLALSINSDGDWDITYINGQPCMTDGFDTAVSLAVFGEPDFWQNGLTNDPNKKYDSEFPDVIKNGRVDDKTLKNGIAAIKKSLKFMLSIGAAQSVDVTGNMLNIFGLYWIVEIVKNDIANRYTINWDKGTISLQRSA